MYSFTIFEMAVRLLNNFVVFYEFNPRHSLNSIRNNNLFQLFCKLQYKYLDFLFEHKTLISYFVTWTKVVFINF